MILVQIAQELLRPQSLPKCKKTIHELVQRQGVRFLATKQGKQIVRRQLCRNLDKLDKQQLLWRKLKTGLLWGNSLKPQKHIPQKIIQTVRTFFTPLPCRIFHVLRKSACLWPFLILPLPEPIACNLFSHALIFGDSRRAKNWSTWRAIAAGALIQLECISYHILYVEQYHQNGSNRSIPRQFSWTC